MEEKLYDMFYGASWIIHKQAKELRKKETKAERILWNLLARKQLGFKFRRQHPINQFIADFYCHEIKLVIEVDGEIHLEKERLEYDEMRTSLFNSFGINVIRFSNNDVFYKSEEVIKGIKEKIRESNKKNSK